MPRITHKCPECNKIAQIDREEKIEALGLLFKYYSCGHAISEALISHTEGTRERNGNWDKLFPFQQQGVKFIEDSNFNCLLADAMSLGKTIQVIQAIKENADKFKCTLYVVKAALKFNWASELAYWYGPDIMDMPYIIGQGDMPILKGLKHYIISMSLLKKKREELVENLDIDLIVIDESHHFKNLTSQRSIALRRLVRDANIKHVICTSGTPVLNRAVEYWPTLNLIKPEHWPSEQSFKWQWCATDWDGKYTGILDYRIDDFFKQTQGYILRREKREVLRDLPEFQRQFYKLDISDSPLAAEYNRTLDELEMHIGSKAITKNNIMVTFGYLNRLRRCCGIAKVPETAEQIKEFLESNPEEKIAIGCHHKAVVQLLLEFLKEYNPVTIVGEDNDIKRLNAERDFRTDSNCRVLVANILAAGEGLNLQFCDNFVVLERQWNAAKEEQFEGRFERPKKCFECNTLLKYKVDIETDTEYYECSECKKVETKRAIIGEYYIAANTIDDFFTSMVEDKRKICADSMGDMFNLETDLESIRDLVDKVIAGGRL